MGPVPMLAPCLSMLLLGCAGRPPVTAGPGAASHALGHPVATTVTAVVQRPLDASWSMLFSGEIALDQILQPTNKVPGVARTQLLHGDDWNTEGAHREVWLTTGDRVEEQITHLQAPNYFSYRTWDLPPPLAGRVDHIRGEWWLEPHPQGTRVVWQYTMIVTRRTVKPFVAGYLRRHMNPFMEQGMAVVVEQIEQRVPAEVSAAP